MIKVFEQQDRIFESHQLALLLVDIAKQRGFHPDKLLKGTKLFYQDIAKKPLKISHQQWVQLVNNASKLNQHDIPFLLGHRLFPAQLGSASAALMNAHNLSDMLRIICCHQGSIFPYFFMSQQRHNDMRYLSFNEAVAFAGSRYFIFMTELLLSALFSAIKWRLGYIPKISVKFPYQTPSYIEQYHANLPCQSSFSEDNICQNVQLSLSEQLIQTPFVDGNRHMLRYHLAQLPVNNRQIGLIQCVLQMIDDYHKKHVPVSLEMIAQTLSISPATLKRKLSAHNTHYQALLDMYRQQKAIFSIVEQGHSTEKVAMSLNFSDLTNFRRSFKRWTGTTPSTLKKQRLPTMIQQN